MTELKKSSVKNKVEAVLFSTGHRISLDEISKLSLEQLSQITGVDKKELEVFVEQLLKENKIKKENDLYILA